MPATSGDLVWLDHWGKERPGVILRVLASGRYYMLIGSTQPQTAPHITVEPNDRAGRLWNLKEPTNVPAEPALVEPEKITEVRPKCPIGLFLDLEEMLTRLHLHIPGAEQGATGPPGSGTT